MDNFIDFIFEKFIIPLLVVLLAIVLVITIIWLIGIIFFQKECAVYGEEYTAHGVLIVNNIVMPTSYQTRDCKVWKGEK